MLWGFALCHEFLFGFENPLLGVTNQNVGPAGVANLIDDVPPHGSQPKVERLHRARRYLLVAIDAPESLMIGGQSVNKYRVTLLKGSADILGNPAIGHQETEAHSTAAGEQLDDIQWPRRRSEEVLSRGCRNEGIRSRLILKSG